MERHEILEAMSELKLYGMRASFDEIAGKGLGAADTIADRAGLPVGALGADQTGDQRIDLIAARKTLSGNLIEARAHAVKLEVAHGFQNLVAFHQAIFLMLS